MSTLWEALVLQFLSTVVKFMQMEETHMTKNQAGAGREKRLVPVARWGWGAVVHHA